jgi:NAD(P)-dependent dehydrogenase (short-subunit alcohol dehydrogenase family)
MRLAGKIAVVVGAGQSPGEGIGNGRATVLRFAQEGARILAVVRDLASAGETAALAAKSGGECVAFVADVTREATLAAAMATAVERWGRIDILHNNVGVSIAGGDKPLDELTEAAFDRDHGKLVWQPDCGPDLADKLRRHPAAPCNHPAGPASRCLAKLKSERLI